MQTRINYRETEEEKKHVRAKKLWRKNCVVAAMERLLLTGRACTDRHGAGACTVTCQVVIFVCRGELDGNWSRLELTAQQREPTRRKEVGIGDRWHHRYGLESTACVRACVRSACVGKGRGADPSAERASEERRGSGQWLGSDQTEPSHKRRIQMCLYLARLPFLSFPLPFLRHAFHLARARGRLVLFTLLIVIAWTVT